MFTKNRNLVRTYRHW